MAHVWVFFDALFCGFIHFQPKVENVLPLLLRLVGSKLFTVDCQSITDLHSFDSLVFSVRVRAGDSHVFD